MVGVFGEGVLDEGRHDRRPGGESKWIFFGPFYNGPLVRVPACPFWPLLWVCGVKKWVKTRPRAAELMIGLHEVSYYCGERRRLMAATLTAFYSNQTAVNKPHVRPALHS